MKVITATQKTIELEQAQALLRHRLSTLPAAELPLGKALHCTLAQDIVATIDQPPFPRSPFDGYALKAADSVGASEETPAHLKVVGRSFAGAPAAVALGQGEAVRIMTGGCIPKGADCVIKQEETDCGEALVAVFRQLSSQENYCHQGEDFQKGAVLVPQGTQVTAAVAAVAAASGYAAVRCVPRVRAALLSTGDELQQPGTPLPAGHIYDANSAYLAARLAELHVHTTCAAPAADDMEALMAGIRQGLHAADCLIITGGVSVGQHDLVPAALAALDAKIVFHGVAMKPGAPALFALLDGKPILALSGNPFAVAASCEVLVRPALAILSGNAATLPRVTTAILSAAYPKASPRRRILRGRLAQGQVVLPQAQGNGQLSTLVGCNCLVDIPAGSTALPAGTRVTAYWL